MSTNRQEILDLLANGKITADEAADLLSKSNSFADEPAEKVPTPFMDVSPKEAAIGGKGKKPAWLHVRVRDMKSGKNKVKVNIPIGMVKFGLKIGSRFSPELNEMNWDDLQAMMHETETGILVDVEDEEDGEHVQVYID